MAMAFMRRERVNWRRQSVCMRKRKHIETQATSNKLPQPLFYQRKYKQNFFLDNLETHTATYRIWEWKTSNTNTQQQTKMNFQFFFVFFFRFGNYHQVILHCPMTSIGQSWRKQTQIMWMLIYVELSLLEWFICVCTWNRAGEIELKKSEKGNFDFCTWFIQQNGKLEWK